MSEIKRVLLSPRRLLALLALVLICLWGLTGANTRKYAAEERACQEALLQKYEGLSLEEAMEDLNLLTENGSYLTREYSTTYRKVSYLLGFEDNLQSIQNRAKTMSTVSIFAGSPYSQANIRKTASDFARLQGISLELGLEQAENTVMQNNRSDYLIAIWMILVVYAFLDERRRGLWNVVCASARGRTALPLWRLAVLAIAAVIGAAVITFTELCAAYALHGGSDQMGRMVQSLPIFANLTTPMTILEFWYFYTGLRALGALALGMTAWLVFELVSDRRLAAGALVLVAALEYAVFNGGNGESVINKLNLFSWIQPRTLVLNYTNVNLFGNPIGQIPLVLLGAAGMILISTGVILIRYRLRRPTDGYAWVDRLREFFQRLTAPMGYHTGLLGHVLHQILFVGKGLIILAVALVVAGSMTDTAYFGSSDPQEVYCESHQRRTQGLLTQDAWDYLEAQKSRLEEDYATRDRLMAQFQAGEIDEDTYSGQMYKYDDLSDREGGLALFEAYLTRISTINNAHVIPQWVYQYLFGIGNNTITQLMGLCLIAVLLVFLFQSGAEKRSGMAKSQQAAPYGRGKLRIHQHIGAWVVTAVFCAGVWACQILGLSGVYGGLPTIHAPACCLDFLSDLSPNITILQYWMLLALERTLLTCGFSSGLLLITGGLQRRR